MTRFKIFAALFFFISALALSPTRADWPERPINVVVMYAPGGGTDTVIRALSAEMSRLTGWGINVTNRTGASGALATRYVLNKRPDGYTILGASNFNKYARVVGGIDTKPWTDWYFMQAAYGIGSWAVRPDSPFKTFEDVVEAAINNPNEITISTSGAGGQVHEMAAILAQAAGLNLKYVPYTGGQVATLAGLNGEVAIAGGGVHEHIHLIDSGHLVPLMQTGTADIVTATGKLIPTIGTLLPEIKDQLPLSGPYTMGIRRDTPIAIIREIEEAFLAAVDSEAFQKVVRRRNIFVDVMVGEDSDRRAAQLEVTTATIFEKLGIPGARTTKDLDLPDAENFDQWWPPEDYLPLPL